MARSKSSHQWLQEHVSDPYVKQAQREGYRSRASYKLIQLHEKDRLIRPGMLIVDLGAAPGGWSQVASRLTGARGRVLATDILPMDPLPDVEFVRGDFTDEAVLADLLGRLAGKQPDLVLCDMAPNLSGVDSADQASAMYLAEIALDFARQVLEPGGTFVVKVFQGSGSDTYIKDLRGAFTRVLIRKPPASRARSREVYAVAKGSRA
jgi:23S rRNA (uridine2552-2'-O)-methyltransferase